MLDFINVLLLMSSPLAAAEPVDAKKVLLKEERYEINRNVNELKNNLAGDEKKTIKENEIIKIAQKNPDPFLALLKIRAGCDKPLRGRLYKNP